MKCMFSWKWKCHCFIKNMLILNLMPATNFKAVETWWCYHCSASTQFSTTTLFPCLSKKETHFGVAGRPILHLDSTTTGQCYCNICKIYFSQCSAEICKVSKKKHSLNGMLLHIYCINCSESWLVPKCRIYLWANLHPHTIKDFLIRSGHMYIKGLYKQQILKICFSQHCRQHPNFLDLLL